MRTAGTYTIAQGTTYEAESATSAGNTTVISNSAFSEGKAIGYIGTSTSFCYIAERLLTIGCRQGRHRHLRERRGHGQAPVGVDLLRQR